MKFKVLLHYLYIFFLTALLALLLLFVAGGFLFKTRKVTTVSGDLVDEFRLSPTRPNPIEVGDQLTSLKTYTLDASNVEKWTYFDFSRGSVIEGAKKKSLDWDLAFRRAKILTNSGATDKEGRGGAIEVERMNFADLASVPKGAEFKRDQRPYDMIESSNSALLKWYEYHYVSHRLDPKPLVYLIRTADGRFAKMKILSYYCYGDKAACYTFQYVYQGNASGDFIAKDAGN